MRQGVTPIEQLINLEDEEKTREETLTKYKLKSIRNTGGRGGMTSYEKFYSPEPEQPSVQMERVRMAALNSMVEDTDEDYISNQMRNINCVDIAHHTHNCLVCSRLYNTDKTIYMVLIGLLSVICLILLKKVLEK